MHAALQLLRTLQSSAHQQLHGIGTSINRARSVGLGSSRSSHEADAGMCAIAPSTRRASAPADPKHSRSLAVTILLVRDEVGEAKRVRARAGKFGLRTSEVAKTGRKPLSFSHPESHPKPDPTPKPNKIQKPRVPAVVRVVAQTSESLLELTRSHCFLVSHCLRTAQLHPNCGARCL